MAHLEGVPQPHLGGLLIMVISHVSKSWDDPPSMVVDGHRAGWNERETLRDPTNPPKVRFWNAINRLKSDVFQAFGTQILCTWMFQEVRINGWWMGYNLNQIGYQF